jgi:hypothetical protein
MLYAWFSPETTFHPLPFHIVSFISRLSASRTILFLCLFSRSHRAQTPTDGRLDVNYNRHSNNEYDPSAQALPSQAGIPAMTPMSTGAARTGTPNQPMDSRTPQQPMQFTKSSGQQQQIGVGNANGEYEEPRRNKFLDILCCRMH